jgi:hypothetical protein
MVQITKARSSMPAIFDKCWGELDDERWVLMFFEKWTPKERPAEYMKEQMKEELVKGRDTIILTFVYQYRSN